MPRIVPFTLEKRAIFKLYIFRFGMTSRFQNYAQWNRIYCRLGEKSQSSHQKSPKPPNGGISPNLLDKTCRASNSAWKNGITSFIRMTQSLVRPIENVAFLRISENFETILHWTPSFEWCLWYQFSTQNLMLFKLYRRGYAKFRHLAILVIFGGYFGSFLPIGSRYDFTEHSYGIVTSCQT